MNEPKDVKDEYDYRLHSQVSKIQKARHFPQLFHQVVPNNFSLVCVSNRIPLEAHHNRVGSSLKQLNVANFNLYHFCKAHYPLVRWNDEQLSADVGDILSRWGNLIKAGNSFLCFDYAKYVIDSFTGSSYPLLEILHEKYYVIVQAFKSTEEWVKSFFKLNVYLDYPSFYERFEELVTYLHREAALFGSIEKLEVAKEYFPFDRKRNAEPYPVLAVFLDCNRVSTRNNPALAQITGALSHLLELAPGEGPPVSYQYSETLGASLSLSQGYKSYKNFLALIGVLDEIYDVRHNYAYVRQ